jgi:hypothetical protein
MTTLATNNITLLTQGLLGDGGLAFVRQGMPVVPGPLPGGPRDTRLVVPTGGALPGMGPIVEWPTTVRDVYGNASPAAAGVLDLGHGKVLSFNTDTLTGVITPQMANDPIGSLAHIYDGGLASYTGSDIRVLIELADTVAGMPRRFKQLLELTTLTVSVHRVKSPVAAAGFINTKGFSRGRRTIAGTLVMTKFTTEVLLRFLEADIITDKSKDGHYLKVDQLPPFNLTILFADEWGHASYQRLLRVEFVTDGSVYSIQDMLTEQTISYMAADFTPLLPLTMSALYSPTPNDPTTNRQRVPSDLWVGPTDVSDERNG